MTIRNKPSGKTAHFHWLPSIGISLDIHCFANGEKNGASFRESFVRRNWRSLFYPSDLVITKTTIPLRVGEERLIYNSKLRVSVYIHHYSPPLRGIVVSPVTELKSRAMSLGTRLRHHVQRCACAVSLEPIYLPYAWDKDISLGTSVYQPLTQVRFFTMWL